MFKNILQTLQKPDTSEINIIFMSTHGNQEYFVKGLCMIFNKVYYFTSDANAWDDQIEKPFNLTDFQAYADLQDSISYIFFDDDVLSYQQADGIAHYLHAPLVGSFFSIGQDVRRNTFVPIDIPELEIEHDPYWKIENQQSLLYALDIPSVSEKQESLIVVDRTCPEQVLLKLREILSDYKIERIEKDNFCNCHSFISSWNHPTIECVTAMEHGAIPAFFKSETNNKFFTHLQNGLCIEDLKQMSQYLDLLQSNKSLYYRIRDKAKQTVANLSFTSFINTWKKNIQDMPYLFYRG